MKRILLASTAIVTSLVVTPAFAVDEAAMLKQMQAMQKQMEQMQSQMNAMKSELAAAKADQKVVVKAANDIKAAKIAKTPESDVKISMVPAPKFETADGAYSFKVGGFGQVDANWSNDGIRDHTDGTNVRRARLNVSGTVAKDWKYKLENDFANNASAITDAYVEYAGLDPVSFTVGQFKEPFGLETLTSDTFTTFNERSLINVFSPDRRIGGMVSAYGKQDGIGAWTAAGGWFGSNTATPAPTDDEAQDITGRLTYAPFSEKTQVLHFGVAGSYRIPDPSVDTYALASRAEHNFSTAAAYNAVNTGTINFVEDINLLSLEAAGVYGPFSLQGEYAMANVDRFNGLDDQSFDGYYVEASYFLTGESRNYNAKTGRFERVSPKWAFKPSEGNWGAFQVAARYSELDLNDSVIKGGKVNDVTVGLRWIPQPYAMVTANYIWSQSDQFAVTPNDEPQFFILRTQFDF